MDLYLIYVNKIGTDFKGEHMFEFLFSDNIEYDWNDDWYESSVITETTDLTPNPNFIKVVGSLKTSDFDLHLIQESGVFQIYNAVEGIIALAWEKLDDDDEYPEERLVFRFGDTKEMVDDKLLELDLALKYKENRQKTN